MSELSKYKVPVVNDLNEGIFDVAKNAVETTISVLIDIPDMNFLLDTLQNYSDQLYAHCVGVSFYSSAIAREMGWDNPGNLYKVSMGGLLHDIGKKEFDKEFLKKPEAK